MRASARMYDGLNIGNPGQETCSGSEDCNELGFLADEVTETAMRQD